MLKRVGSYPIHFVMGLTQIGIGLFLAGHDHYFRWPPEAWLLGWVNDDAVGGILVLLGAGFIWWVLDSARSVRMNHLLLSFSAGALILLTVYQFLHWVIMGLDMPWISNAALTAIIMILAARSDSVEH